MAEHNGGAEEIEGLVMPTVPESLGVDPVLLALLHLTSLLDFADDDELEPDAANAALERIELYLQRLPSERLEAIQADLDRIEEYGAEQGWPEELTDFVRDFLFNCGLGDDDDDDDDDETPLEDE